MAIDIAIDIGSSNTRIFINGKGIVLNEPTVVAVNLENEEIIAVGRKAYNMLGRTAEKINLVFPIVNGVVTDSDLAEKMLRKYIKSVFNTKFIMQRVIVNLPGGLTDLEKHNIVSIVNNIGFRKVCLLDTCKASIMGLGLDICSPIGRLCVDIGGGTTEVAAISLGDISVSKSIKIAGNNIDEEIIKFVRKKYNLIIGKRMAEQAKINICCAYPPNEIVTFTVKGRNSINGLPRSVELSNIELLPLTEEFSESVAKLIQDVLDEAPPELLGDIYNDGIVLSGGSSLIKGLDKYISNKTKIDISVGEDPAESVIRGCGKSIQFINSTSTLNPIKYRF